MSKTALAPQVFTRALVETVEVRSIDEEKRTALFVAATETGVRTWNGKEYLRVKGIDLKRYKKNPVVLDTHNRWEAGAVIGNASVKVEGRELLAEVRFADTARAEEIWKLVKGRFLHALSVGFIPLKAYELEEGGTDGSGDSKIVGPGRVISQSELFEISVVPVPADPEALRRTFLEEYAMDKEKEVETPPAPPKQVTPAASQEEVAEERALRIEKARVEHIRMICPRGIEQVADLCIAENLSVDESRKRMLEAQKERAKPIGTPEPAAPKGEEKEKAPEVSDETLLRSLGSPAL